MTGASRYQPKHGRLLLGLLVAAALVLAVETSPARADENVYACGIYPNHIFKPVSSYGLNYTDGCTGPPSGALDLNSFGNTLSQGQNALWQASAPAGLTIVGVNASDVASNDVNAGSLGDYGGDFYWQGGDQNIQTTMTSFGALMSSSFFGFQLICGKPTCTRSSYADLGGITLYVRETAGPTFTAPSGLWHASGWVRGSWPVSGSSDSPSGVCSLSATINGSLVAQQVDVHQDATQWHQCAVPPVSQTIDTAHYGQGPLPLTLFASDAAGVPASQTDTVYVDNQQPTVALSGPSDAPSTAGTQYVTATAAAGPSGVAGISCSVDRAPAQWFAASAAQIAVSGIGTHQVQCTAENNAVDSAGVHGSSAPATYSVRIGLPTVAVVAFSKVVNKLRCHRVTERVHIPARWVKVRVKGRVERVREKAHTQKIKVTRCHARTVQRRITREVTIHRHGKRVRVKRSRTVRVVVEPRTVFKTSHRVRHGQGSTVSGWLGTATGVALGGQTVDVLTAADNGRENFHVAAVATTAANGGWSAKLPAGPSRLVEAGYPGAATTEGAISAPAHLIVPAKVQLLGVSPRRVPWGGTVHLVGQLKGGYLPRGGALVRLRIGLGNSDTTYGVREHVTGDGRFRTDYTFGAGDPAARRSFWFQIASLPMGDYPYAPASSRRLTVRVGGHPRPARHH
jgi:hypothetical protein